MKTNRYIPVWVVVAVLIMLSSCVKDILYNTPHPESGAVVLMLEGAPDGEVFVAGIDGQTADMDGLPFTWPELLKPGDYSLVVHNRAEGFAFDGRTARVDAVAGSSDAGEVLLNPLPGDLHTCSCRITVVQDDTVRMNAVVERRTRDLMFELEVTQGRPELIQTVTGTLRGIAGTFDMEAGQTTGDAASTAFSFTRDGSKLTAEARLLGTMGAVQTLVLDIVFTDGGRTQRTEVDLTEALADFNGDMTTDYRVTGTLETPVGMEEGKGEITGWEPVEGGDVSAEM